MDLSTFCWMALAMLVIYAGGYAVGRAHQKDADD